LLGNLTNGFFLFGGIFIVKKIMQDTKNLVEEALIQMKNVEDVIAENAKGILASTMKEEISQLVKESLSEQETEDEIEVDAELDMTMDDEADNDEGELEMDDMEMGDMEMDMGDEETIDLTNASDEEILKIFKAMGEEDGIIVKKDGGDVHIKDTDEDVEYIVKLDESEEEEDSMEFNEELDEEDTDLEAVLSALGLDEEDEEMTEMEDMYMEDMHMDDEEEEVVYEIEMSDEDEDGEMMEYDEMEEMGSEDYHLEEAKMTVKPKGVGMGNPKFKYGKTLPKKGFDEKKKEGPKTMGTGKAKFEFKEGEMEENWGSKKHEYKRKDVDGVEKKAGEKKGHYKDYEKEETKEAARTYGMGSKEGRGLRKGITNNRNYNYGNNGVKVESVGALETEMKVLREKNEEYRKALNVFREKLNEVAVFNSNLAYATRLFTEHSTTKKEKINILRRFDSVETLKESKQLYKTLKDELGSVDAKSINESVDKAVNNSMSSGSAQNLIESKTYENPQFMRIKDLMSKM
jgi:hypothetical protein